MTEPKENERAGARGFVNPLKDPAGGNSRETVAAAPAGPVEKPSGQVVEFKSWMSVTAGEASGDLFRQRLRLAGIPKKFMEKRLQNFSTPTHAHRKVLEAARDYVAYFCNNKGQGVNGLWLHGRVGTGKTYIAVGILREVLGQGFSGLYCNVPEFLKNIRATYGSVGGPDEGELIDETRDVDLLVLDDLGVEGRVLDPVRDRSKWLCERLYLIVNGRYEVDKPIVMTSNCDLDVLQQQLDERTVSRLMEMTWSRKFPPFPDKDYRRSQMS